jgi:hypothetical protein
MIAVRIQLLTFDGCPLADAAREQLEAALAELGINHYEELDLQAPGTPESLRGWGSPTILVDGADITGQPKGGSLSCRVYGGPDKVLSAANIISAFDSRRSRKPGQAATST